MIVFASKIDFLKTDFFISNKRIPQFQTIVNHINMLIFIEKTNLLQLFIKQKYKTQVKKSLLNKQIGRAHV